MTIERSAAATAQDRGPSRLDFLDMLRGVAALSVFVSHVGERVWSAFKHMVYTSFDLGNFGVMLFFLCSGFIIPISLEQQGSLWRFWVRRILRLYPLYWFSIALSIVLDYAMAGDVTISDFLAKNAATILANMTMLQIVFGFDHIHGEYWTLMFGTVLLYDRVGAVCARDDQAHRAGGGRVDPGGDRCRGSSAAALRHAFPDRYYRLCRDHVHRDDLLSVA